MKFRNKTNALVSLVTLFMLLSSCNYSQTGEKEQVQNINSITAKKMKVEIWSDVMCPFCYIGKRKFESALAEFKYKDNIEVEWKSFQLNPNLKTDPSKNTVQHLAETKGWSMDYTRNTVKYVSEMAKEVGLNYDFDRAVVANSFDAHRLIQYAKTLGKGDAAEERLFKAYFTEGKNTADHSTLIELGTEIGLDASEIKKVLESTVFSTEVNADIRQAEQIGVSGVPFFVLDRKYAVSGAQDSKVFLNSLEKAWNDYSKANRGALSQSNAGAVCNPEGECK